MKKIFILLAVLTVGVMAIVPTVSATLFTVETVGDATYNSETGEFQLGPDRVEFWGANQPIGTSGITWTFLRSGDFDLSFLAETADDGDYDRVSLYFDSSDGLRNDRWQWWGQDSWSEYTIDRENYWQMFSVDAGDTLNLSIFTGRDRELSTRVVGVGTTAPVPEPETMLLFGAGLIGLAGVGRKKRL